MTNSSVETCKGRSPRVRVTSRLDPGVYQKLVDCSRGDEYITRDVARVARQIYIILLLHETTSFPVASSPGTRIRMVALAWHCLFEMLFEILRWNFIPRKADDEDCHILSARSCSNTVSLDSSFGRQSTVKPHFRGNRHTSWVSVLLGSNPLFFPHIPSRRPNRKFTRVSKAYGSLGVPAPCQESPGGEGTRVVVAADNGYDGSVLKLRDDRQKHLWGSIGLSSEHHGG